MTIFSAKVLEVEVEELNLGDNSQSEYTFNAYEFTNNGVVMVLGSTTNDYFFIDCDSIEANGNGVVIAVNETDRTVEFTVEQLAESIEGSVGEFGEDEATAKALELIA
jgi:hypothetical protein